MILLPEHIRSKFEIDPGSDCWVWTACIDSHGYGNVWVDGRCKKAHRACYEFSVGPIPEGLTLDHLCRNRACVNPLHMEPVTLRENIQRGNQGLFNRLKTHCSRGHTYDDINTIRRRGRRVCATCERARQKVAKQAERDRKRLQKDAA